MYQPVDSGNRHHVVVEYLIPSTEWLIRCDDEATGFIAMGNKLEQYLSFLVALFYVTDVIDDQY